jgi:hypothetical protein
MIDTDKYTGHTPVEIWQVVGQGEPEDNGEYGWHIPYWMACNKAKLGNHKADALLIADAPLLLAEVERLRYWDEEMDRVIATLDEHNWASSDGDVHDIVTHILAEVERLRKLEAAVVGSWMEACEHRGPWHKALRYPCVELGYLVLEGHTFELAEEYQEIAKEWIRQKMVEIYGEDWND